MAKKVYKFEHDTLATLRENDLVQQAKALLEATIESTDILNIKDMSPDDLAKARLVLGFLNATNSIMKTKMGVLKVSDVANKIKALEDQVQEKAKTEGKKVKLLE